MPFNPILGTDLDDIALNGTALDDEITLLDGNDSSDGDDGNDLIYGGAGIDTLRGGAGNDTLFADEFQTASTDYLYGGAGDDLIEFDAGNGGEAWGGSGIDTLFLNWGGGLTYTEDLTITLTGAVASATQGGATLLISGMEQLILNAGSGNDTVTSGNRADWIIVNDGANTVSSLGGDDSVSYVIDQVNTLDGGSGTDWLYVSGDYYSDNTFTVTGNTATDNIGSLITNFERYAYTGGTLNDTAVLGSGADYAAGGDGDDILATHGGDDTLDGGTGADDLATGTGADWLTGGAGIDTLTGGGGADMFVFYDADETGDLIRDFQVGTDDLQIASAVTLGLLVAGDTVIISEGAAIGTDAQFVRLYDAAANTTLLSFDADGIGAGAGILIAELTGNKFLTDGDIIIS